jgi:triacylglycerol lipase
VETNGAHLAKTIDQILEETGAEKLNVIAHSKGGLDTRYVISTLGYADKIASLTTISSPHNGSKFMDLLMKFPHFLIRFGSAIADVVAYIIGDEAPKTYRVLWSFTTTGAKKFNAENPDSDQVFYQSYAFVMKNPFSDIIMAIPNTVIRLLDGPNDGLLTPNSVKWGEFRGVYTGAGRRGISHCDEVDLRRHRLSRKRNEGVSDMVELYQEIVKDLKNRGF